MAIVEFINGQNKKIAGLVRAIDYVVDENKTEVFSFSGIDENDIPGNQEDKEALFVEKLISEDKVDRAINYITKDGKTSERLVTGINCSPESAFDEMMVTKNMYNKTSGRQFIHFVHSYSNKEENLTSEIAHEISLKLLEDRRFEGFEIIAATHTDKDHLHTHFILNTVNAETGRKWNQSPWELEKLKKSSNKLCYDYGLKHSFTNTKNDKFINRENYSSGEYRARKKRASWKHELELTINECKKISKSREEFITNMESLNYKVRWEDTRKYITFTTPSGKLCRNNKLENLEDYTKEALEKIFSINKQIYDLSKEGTGEILDEIQEEKKRSWKYPLYISIKEVLKTSTSREDFIKNMNNKGYEVRWEDSRKDITFTNPEGRKCNNDKLHPQKMFTKEALEERFKINRNKINTKNSELENRVNTGVKEGKKEESIEIVKNIIFSTSQMLKDNPDRGNKDYPLSYLEGQTLKEKMLEKAKGEGLDWEKEQER